MRPGTPLFPAGSMPAARHQTAKAMRRGVRRGFEWDADEPTPAGLTDAEAAAYQIGAAYWAAVGPEVLALIEEEKAYCA